MAEQEKPNIAAQHRLCRTSKRFVDSTRFVFLDETGARINIICCYGCAPRGDWNDCSDLHCHAPAWKADAMNILQALLTDTLAVIFDCDGTLVDTSPLYARAWAAGFRHSGKEMPAGWYLTRAGMSEHVLMDAIEVYAGVKLDRGEVARLMHAAFLDELHALREIEAVAAIARENHGRLPLAVASAGSRTIVTATLRATGLMGLFHAIVTLDDVGHAKPEPDLFLEAARRLDITAAKCLVLEDSREGLEAAARAGMRSIDVANILGSA